MENGFKVKNRVHLHYKIIKRYCVTIIIKMIKNKKPILIKLLVFESMIIYFFYQHLYSYLFNIFTVFLLIMKKNK
jgi:hypothetical protein